ncbi:hypothetical protein LAZ67_12002719 [Cordylochernes scorpioides]|uniref:Transposase n=1 Tax=Cordylochernes scorpioides TaxID=51811 RepID=A0ABY6L4Q7_9ARAC|nr:hypothetical protein LAZ67_12002719 [Cordylochernes scorpioides]
MLAKGPQVLRVERVWTSSLDQILRAMSLYRLDDHSWVSVDVCSAMPDALHDVFWARWRILTFGAIRKDLPIFKNHAPKQRKQRLFEVKPFCPCFDFVSHRNGGSTNLHQVLCEKRIQGCRNFWMFQTAYGDAVMSRRRVFEWYKPFKEGREETADNERSGRPSTSTTPEKVDKVLELVREDRRITVREVAEEAGISFGSTQSIMKDILGVRRLNAVLVPKDLTFDQTNARKETASLNLEVTTDNPELLKRVITGDETWIYGFDSETTLQSRFGPLRLLPFLKAQKKLKGRKFLSIEEIKVESKKAMKAIPKTDYQRCFADWKKRWLKCIAANGDYFERDNLNLVSIPNIRRVICKLRCKFALSLASSASSGEDGSMTLTCWCQAMEEDILSRGDTMRGPIWPHVPVPEEGQGENVELMPNVSRELLDRLLAEFLAVVAQRQT